MFFEEIQILIKGQENSEFWASVTPGSFPNDPVAGSGMYGNRPVGPEILNSHAKREEILRYLS